MDLYSQLTQPAAPDDDTQATTPAVGWGQLKGFGLGNCRLALLESNKEYTLGRHSTCHLTFNNAQVSNKHCTILRIDKDQQEQVLPTSTSSSKLLAKEDEGSGKEEEKEGTEAASTVVKAPQQKGIDRHPSADKALVVLYDHSSNGTYVNGRLVGKGKQVALRHKDMISLATKNAQIASPDLFLIYEDFSEKHSVGAEDEDLKEMNEKYYLTEVILGTGNFATVKLAFHPTTGEKYAVKVINKHKFIQKPKFHEHLVTEITILKKLNHPGIVRIFDVVDTTKSVYIFLELISGGELFHLIATKGNLSETTTKLFFYQILLAVQYLHDHNVIHRDLKPENLLIDKKGEFPLVKITDFGLAKIVGEESFMKTLCGTPNYIAPEVLSQTNYNKAVDCWSLGVILYAMLAGSLPFSDDDKKSLFEQIRSGNFDFPEEDWKYVSPQAKSLIRGLIKIDPAKRLTVKQALEHPWLQDEEIRTMVDSIFQTHKVPSSGKPTLSPTRVDISMPTVPNAGDGMAAKSSTGTDSDLEAPSRGKKRQGESAPTTPSKRKPQKQE